MRKTYSAGGVVLNKEGKILIVNQKRIDWSLPKGHIEKKEDKISTAKREICEETGINKLFFIRELGTYERPKMDSENKDDKEEMKVMTFFLFTTPEIKLSPQDKDNPEARWVNVDDVEHLLTHPKDKAFFRKIKSKLRNKSDLRSLIGIISGKRGEEFEKTIIEGRKKHADLHKERMKGLVWGSN